MFRLTLFFTSLAAAFAGIGFGNAGVHLCHGMSYPVCSSSVKFDNHSLTGLGRSLV